MNEFADLLSSIAVPDAQLGTAVFQLFERIKLAAIFTKHDGFKEEAEWRIAYLKERDPEGKLADMMGYGIGRNGVEPKLKFKIQPLNGVTAPDLSLEKLVHQIILGPMISGALAKQSVKRMLRTIRNTPLADRVEVSTIPYRPS